LIPHSGHSTQSSRHLASGLPTLRSSGHASVDVPAWWYLLWPPADVVDALVWRPIAELPAREVFAFGRPWDNLASGLGLPRTHALGAGGRDYGSTVPSRAIRVYGLPSGQRLIVEWHTGGAGPPSGTETAILKAALT
jgi:hypothetical protein